jgi:hypothetical protein
MKKKKYMNKSSMGLVAHTNQTGELINGRNVRILHNEQKNYHRRFPYMSEVNIAVYISQFTKLK